MKANNEDEFEVKYIKFLTLSVGTGFVLMIIIWMVYSNNKNSKYTLLEKATGFEKRIAEHDAGRGVLYLDFEDNSKYKLTHYAHNYEYDPPNLFSFIVVGDIIEKKANTDTIIVKRQLRRTTNQYLFIIGQELNKRTERH